MTTPPPSPTTPPITNTPTEATPLPPTTPVPVPAVPAVPVPAVPVPVPVPASASASASDEHALRRPAATFEPNRSREPAFTRDRPPPHEPAFTRDRPPPHEPASAPKRTPEGDHPHPDEPTHIDAHIPPRDPTHIDGRIPRREPSYIDESTPLSEPLFVSERSTSHRSTEVGSRTPPHRTEPADGCASVTSGGDATAEVDAERLARAGLVRVVEPGDPAAIAAFDGMEAQELWQALHEKRPMFERWSARVAEARPEVDLERAAAAGARFVIPGDDEWPEQVEVLADAGLQSRRGGVPFGLWVRGPAQLRETLAKSVAVVGARACSAYGENAASELAAGLADEGVTVVSGGAYGIDAAAHRGALASGGPTVAVLACGVDVSYPKSNTALFDRIAETGLLISELPPRCSPTKLRFLARNRLIAATTLGTVVVEAAIRSGALNSAGWAEQCGRQVLAVPGPITSRMSEGVHLLIRERNAALATNVADILEAISPIGTHTTPYPHAPATITDHLDHDLSRTLDAVPVLRPAHATRIATTAGLDLDTTQECLETLADSHLIEYTPTGWRLSPTHRQSL